jgi:hypothetical protein
LCTKTLFFYQFYIHCLPNVLLAHLPDIDILSCQLALLALAAGAKHPPGSTRGAIGGSDMQILHCRIVSTALELTFDSLKLPWNFLYFGVVNNWVSIFIAFSLKNQYKLPGNWRYHRGYLNSGPWMLEG